MSELKKYQNLDLEQKYLVVVNFIGHLLKTKV
jgi:hypothetical protein